MSRYIVTAYDTSTNSDKEYLVYSDNPENACETFKKSGLPFTNSIKVRMDENQGLIKCPPVIENWPHPQDKKSKK